MKKIHYFLLLSFLLSITIIIILFFVRSKSSSDSDDIDTSDVPCPPNSLEYNATYSPPKRNCNLQNASSAIDNSNESYILEDLDYNL